VNVTLILVNQHRCIEWTSLWLQGRCPIYHLGIRFSCACILARQRIFFGVMRLLAVVGRALARQGISFGVMRLLAVVGRALARQRICFGVMRLLAVVGRALARQGISFGVMRF
jgi:hypothetical protein